MKPRPISEDDGPRLPRETAVVADGEVPVGLDARLVAALERAGHALRVLLWERAKAHGLSPIQVQLMMRLASEPAQRRRVGLLAAEFDVTTPTVSDAVAALRRKRLVVSEQIEGDRRSQLLTLTALGRKVSVELRGWHNAVAEQLADIAEPDKAATLEILLDLVGGLHREGVINVARMCTTCRFFARDVTPDGGPHRCMLLDVPLPAADLRVDCAEHESIA